MMAATRYKVSAPGCRPRYLWTWKNAMAAAIGLVEDLAPADRCKFPTSQCNFVDGVAMWERNEVGSFVYDHESTATAWNAGRVQECVNDGLPMMQWETFVPFREWNFWEGEVWTFWVPNTTENLEPLGRLRAEIDECMAGEFVEFNEAWLAQLALGWVGFGPRLPKLGAFSAFGFKYLGHDRPVGGDEVDGLCDGRGGCMPYYTRLEGRLVLPDEWGEGGVGAFLYEGGIRRLMRSSFGGEG